MNTLKIGDTLAVGQEIVSDNGQYRLTMQGDGNLVLASADGSPVWTSKSDTTDATPRASRATLTDTGNLVLDDQLGRAHWAALAVGDVHPDARLVLQDDRNLVLYDAAGAPIWATMTQIPDPSLRTAEVSASKSADVGAGKRMDTTAVLYRDGRLVVDSYTRNDNWFGGLRGRTLVVMVDAGGRSIWVSNELADPTRCSVPDPSCASQGRKTFVEQYPEPVGRFTERLDIYQSDGTMPGDFRKALIDAIKAGGDVAAEVIAVWGQLG